jgi:CheY-like chemotaxis protein
MSAYFRRAGFELELASGLEQGIAFLAQPFDVIVCDLHLSPDQLGEGLALLEAARRLAPAVPIVLLSGDGAPELGALAPDAVLQKPLRMAQLAKLLSELIARNAST